MLYEVEVRASANEVDREGQRVLAEAQAFGLSTITQVSAARCFLIEGQLNQSEVEKATKELLADPIAEVFAIRSLPTQHSDASNGTTAHVLLNVLYKPGVTDNTGHSTKAALQQLGLAPENVATLRRYWLNHDVAPAELSRLEKRILANDAIERVLTGPLALTTIGVGAPYQFRLQTVPLRSMTDTDLAHLSKAGQLYLSLVEMQTIQRYFQSLDRDPTDIELETVAQTWSEHCSHKTLAGRIRYSDEQGERLFQNMLKETIFAATQTLRKKWGANDWCVSVFKDNAGIVTFDQHNHACFKVETHNHPSAIEPYGGANTGIGGVIRDPLGTGLGARPVCNTDIFCFAPPNTPAESLPPGVLHPRLVAKGVVAGVRDYGNRMGIPTVNGAVFFDPRYLGNPLVYCGTAGLIPVDRCDKHVSPGELIVAIGGRTGRDGIHGATFSSAELTQESETISGGAVQIGNAVTEKMLMDVLLAARDQGLYSAVTDCGAGGFSSAVGEMGEETGAEVWLHAAPLKYAGLSYTEIWISEAQERMVLSVPEANWPRFQKLCAAEGVEASVLGKFSGTGRLVLKYHGETVADLAMEFLHEGRPPVVRDASYQPAPVSLATIPTKANYGEDLKAILGSLNVCSKEWIIRQYDHEVQAGSVVKPLVGVALDGPSDAAVVRPDLSSRRGLVFSNGMNPYLGDYDPYWMAANAIDEAIRNCVAVGANPARIAILDNFCWGNTERPETLGTLVRAALACHDFALTFETPFISGKDSLNNEFSFFNEQGQKQTVAIPCSLLISAMGQIDDIHQAVTMDLKGAGNSLYQIGLTTSDLGGSHWLLTQGQSGGQIPHVDKDLAPQLYKSLHTAISQGLIQSCHDLSEGGLAVTLAEMAFAGGLGAEVQLERLAQQSGLTDPGTILFSESPSRFVVEVTPTHATAFEQLLAHLPVTYLGQVTDSPHLIIRSTQATPIINEPLTTLKSTWQAPLAWD